MTRSPNTPAASGVSHSHNFALFARLPRLGDEFGLLIVYKRHHHSPFVLNPLLHVGQRGIHVWGVRMMDNLHQAVVVLADN